MRGRVRWLWAALVQRLGSLTQREMTLLGATWVLVIMATLSVRLVFPAYDRLRKEEIRLRASRVAMDELVLLLEQREEIMGRAQVLVQDYLATHELEASNLVVQRIDRTSGRRTLLRSLYPIGAAGPAGPARFRAELEGLSGEIARLLFSLGEGVPPILASDISLSGSRDSQGDVVASVVLDVAQMDLPDEWLDLFAHWSDGTMRRSVTASARTGPATSASEVRPGGAAPDQPDSTVSWMERSWRGVTGAARRGWARFTGREATGELERKDPAVRDGKELRGQAKAVDRAPLRPTETTPHAKHRGFLRRASAWFDRNLVARLRGRGVDAETEGTPLSPPRSQLQPHEQPGHAASRPPPRRPAPNPPGASPFPYAAIDRPGLFRSTIRDAGDGRLGVATPTIQSLTQSLALVGVIWKANPVAIISDAQTGQSHHRKVGEHIGELEITAIRRNSVTLRYKDEEARLE